jgi:hypothetical protein
MTTFYVATIEHHSLARAPSVKIEGTLTQAKRAATERFGDGFADHQICIYERRPDFGNVLVATKAVGAPEWIAR